MFDGEPVAVPSRHIGAPEPFHGLELDDDVLQYFIQRVADVDVAVRIGRAVVQDVGFLAFRMLLELVINIFPLPVLDGLWFQITEIGLHGKIGFRQIERRFVIHLVGDLVVR